MCRLPKTRVYSLRVRYVPSKEAWEDGSVWGGTRAQKHPGSHSAFLLGTQRKVDREAALMWPLQGSDGR